MSDAEAEGRATGDAAGAEAEGELGDEGPEDGDDLEDLEEEPAADERRTNRVPGATATGVLEYLVTSLVADPEAVEIDVDGGRSVALRVHVAPGDMGRVIGRRGRVANAIRSVVRAAAVRDGLDVDVDFVD